VKCHLEARATEQSEQSDSSTRAYGCGALATATLRFLLQRQTISWIDSVRLAALTSASPEGWEESGRAATRAYRRALMGAPSLLSRRAHEPIRGPVRSAHVTRTGREPGESAPLIH
jgi:hypothetical protein